MIGISDTKDAWILERHGRFTSSENSKLLSKGNGTEMFGAGALTYIRQKAIEKMTSVWERPEMEWVKSLLHGKMYEAPAFEWYKKITFNYSMRYFGTDDPIYLSRDDDSGGSPDGLMGEGINIHWGLELKCPKSSSVHLDHMLLKNQYELQEYNIQYYTQIQDLLDITGAPGWHFASFDDRFTSPKMKMKVLDVLPDRKFIDNLEIRRKMAVKRRNEMIEMFLRSAA